MYLRVEESVHPTYSLRIKRENVSAFLNPKSITPLYALLHTVFYYSLINISEKRVQASPLLILLKNDFNSLD